MTKRKRQELSALRQPASAPLLDDVRQLIVDARVRVAAAVNAGLTLLYWQIGQRIRKGVLQEKRAEYGEESVPTLSAQLVPEFGQGFSSRNLARMVRGDFASLAQQKRIGVDNQNFSLDLLFYHCRLRRMVAIKLKLGKFVPADIGQRELRRHRLFSMIYPQIWDSLPPEFTQALSNAHAHVDMRDALTPAFLMTGMDILRTLSFIQRPYPAYRDSGVLLRGCGNTSYWRTQHEKPTCTGTC